MKTDTLKDALAYLAKSNDATVSSEDLLRARQALDIPGAVALHEELEGRRASLLLIGTDSAISKIEAEMRTAHLDIERRRAASKALEPVIADAQAREKQAAIEQLGVETRELLQQVAAAYVELDEGTCKLVQSLALIRAGEADLTAMNARLREAGRGDLIVDMPIFVLPHLTGIDAQFWTSPLSWAVEFPGYTSEPAGREGVPLPGRFLGKRRYAALAQLLPDAPAKKAA